MARYVPDILTHRWVIIAPQRMRRSRSGSVAHKKTRTTHKKTPLCPGNEQETPPEVLRIGDGKPNTPGWQVRVISNKYPVTDFHEVFVHSPECDKGFHELKPKHIELIFHAYRERFVFYKEKGQVLIFCNEGLNAGASLIHSHSQLVVLPFQINIDTLAREPLNNMVADEKHFSVYCPDFSQWPYEIWIAPKRPMPLFGNITDPEISELSSIMKKVLGRLHTIYSHLNMEDSEFGYNYYIYPKTNWYIRIIPRFVHRAGFELGTGLSVNVVDPADAAKAYQGCV